MMGSGARLLVTGLVSLMLVACARAPVVSAPVSERAAIEQRLMADITMLASDDFAGRKPGTPGEEKTLAYLETRMAEVGLVSGTNDPGSYWQEPVALVGTVPRDHHDARRVGIGQPLVARRDRRGRPARRRAGDRHEDHTLA